MEQRTKKSERGQIVLGKLRFLRRPALELTASSRLSWEEEEVRFFRAQQKSMLQLGALYDRALHWVGDELASVFAIHAMMLEDEEFTNAVQAMIRENGATAEYAVQTVWNTFAAGFEALDSPYMQARAVDIRDICRRMLGQMLHLPWEEPLRKGPAILVADEFFPSDVMELDHRRLLGVVSRNGSEDSHTAFLLRAGHIPAIHRMELDEAWDGRLALMDGENQRLYLEPSREVLEQFQLPAQEKLWTRPRQGEALEPQIV